MFAPKPFHEDFLQEENGHKVFYAQYGNKDGETIISCHGGPGSCSKSKHATNFDLNKYRVVLFDQRGCGKSEYIDQLSNNTTQNLIADMEKIRTSLGIDSWYVSGSSWGSTLSLSYAIAHPKRVKGLLLSAIFLGDTVSVDWFSGNHGVAMMFRDVFEQVNQDLKQFGTALGESRQINSLLHTSSAEDQRKLVATILNWEGNLFTSEKDVTYLSADDVTEQDITYAKVFMHYESNNFFISDQEILSNIDSIQDVPIIIAHGRHDILCPYDRAFELKKLHGNTKLVALPQSNHKISADGEIARKYIFESFLQEQNLQ